VSWKERVARPDWKSAEDLARLVNPLASGLDLKSLLAGVRVSWSRIELDRADEVVADELWAMVRRPSDGLVVVVSDASWRTAGPIVVTADHLPDLISQHAQMYGEPCFGGDVVIVALEPPRLIVVHHDGLVGEVAVPGSSLGGPT